MAFALRKEGDTDNPVLAVPYGKQITAGRLAYYDKKGNRTAFISLLGQGIMDGIDRVYYSGELIPEFDAFGNRNWRFHPGTLSTGYADPVQGRPEFFPDLDFTFSGIAYIEVLLPETWSSDDGEEPSKMKFMVRGKRVQDYTLDGSGNLVPNGAPVFSANNALVAADIMTTYMKLPLSRIDGTSLLAFKTRCDEVISWVGGGTATVHPTYQHKLGVTVNAETGEVLKNNSDGWNSYAATSSYFNPTTGDGFYEFTVTGRNLGSFQAGLTSLTSGITNTNFVLSLGFEWNGGLAYHVGSTAVSIGTWSDGNVFRIASEGGVYKIYQNGQQLNLTLPTVPNAALRGAVAIYNMPAGITSSRFSPASIDTNAPMQIKRFESHTVFPSEVDATVALEAVMFRAPGCHWQDVNGKIRFITEPNVVDLSQWTSGKRAISWSLTYDPTQTYRKSNIVADSFSAYRKSSQDKPNFTRFEFRDLNDEYYTKGYVFKDRQNLRDQAGSLIDPGVQSLGVMTQSQADRIAEALMRTTSDLDLFVTIKGMAGAFQVAKGDVVRLSHDVPGWRESAPPLFIVIEETFEPTIGEGGTADERSFVLQIYNPEFYSDTAHGAIVGVISSGLRSQFAPPMTVDNIVLTEGARTVGDGQTIPVINGTVYFHTFPNPQIGQVFIKRPGDADFRYTGIEIRPDPVSLTASFQVDAAVGTNFIRIVTASTAGASLQPVEVHKTVSRLIIGQVITYVNPDPPLVLNVAKRDGNLTWTWTPPSNNRYISFYEVRDSDTGTVLFAGDTLSWTEAIRRGAMNRVVYSATRKADGTVLYSLVGASKSYTQDIPAAVQNYSIEYDGFALMHRFKTDTPSGYSDIDYYQISSNSSFTQIVGTPRSGVYDEAVDNTTASWTRWIRGVDKYGNEGIAVLASTSFNPFAAPDVVLDTNQNFLFDKTVIITPTGTINPNLVKRTEVEVTPLGGIASVRRFNGLQRTDTISGRASTATTVSVRARFVDALERGNWSVPITLTFVTIGGADISDIAITSNKIAPLNITSPLLAEGSVVFGKLGANSVAANNIIAGSVTAQKLSIGNFSAINLDPAMSDLTAWVFDPLAAGTSGYATSVGTVVTISDGISGRTALRSSTVTTPYYSLPVPIDASRQYRLSAKVRKVGADGTLYVGIVYFDGNGNVITSPSGTRYYYFAATGVSATSEWAEYPGVLGMGTANPTPSNAKSASVAVMMNYGGSSGYMEAQDVRLDAMVTGILLADNTVTSNKMVAESITAREIAVGAVTAEKIGASTGAFGIVFANQVTSNDYVRHQSAAPHVEQLMYMNRVNLVVTAEGGLGKVSGGDAWNSYAVSNRAIYRGDGYIEFTIPNTTFPDPMYYMIGLTHTLDNGSFEGIKYAFYPRRTSGVNYLDIYEQGAGISTGRTWSVNDILRIAIEGSNIVYYHNGIAIRTVAGTVGGLNFPRYPMRAQVCIHTPETEAPPVFMYGILTDAVLMSPQVSFTYAGNTSVGVLSANQQYFTHAVTNTFHLRGTETCSGEGYIEFISPNTTAANQQWVVGITDTGSFGTDYTAMSHGVHHSINGYLHIYSPSTSWVNLGIAYGTQDIYRLGVENGVVVLRRNGVVVYTFDTAAPATWRPMISNYAGTHTPNLYFNKFGTEGAGWRLHPKQGNIFAGMGEFNEGILIKDQPLNEAVLRSIGSIKKDGTWRGRDRKIVDNKESFGMNEYRRFADGDDVWFSLFFNTDIAKKDTANADSTDNVILRVYNKFGEQIKTQEFPWSWRGVCAWGFHRRDFADPQEEAVYSVEVHNSYGHSRKFWYSSANWMGSYNPGWASGNQVAPTNWVKKSDCPQNLQATPASDSSVTLTWQPSPASNQGMIVGQTAYYRRFGSVQWIVAASLGGTTSTYTVTGLSPYTLYEFITEGNVSNSWSETRVARTFPSLPPQPALTAPSGLSAAAASTTAININWTNGVSTSTEIYRSSNGGATWTHAATLGSGVTTYQDSGLSVSTNYTYRVRHHDGSIASSYSNLSSATTMAAPPPTTTPHSANAVATGYYSINVSFQNPGDAATIQYGLDGVSFPWSVAASSNPTPVGGLADGTTYYFRVSNSSGVSNVTNATTDLFVRDEPDPRRWKVDPLTE